MSMSSEQAVLSSIGYGHDKCSKHGQQIRNQAQSDSTDDGASFIKCRTGSSFAVLQ